MSRDNEGASTPNRSRMHSSSHERKVERSKERIEQRTEQPATKVQSKLDLDRKYKNQRQMKQGREATRDGTSTHAP